MALEIRVRSQRCSSAFTLVELLVVIGVIAILLGALLPSLYKARQSSLRLACMANLKALGLGVSIYAAEFKGIVPWEGYAEGDRPERSVGYWDEPSLWMNACPAYVKYPSYNALQLADLAGGPALPKGGDKGLFVCPEAYDAIEGGGDDLVINGYFMMWGVRPNGAPQRRKTFLCYGYNTQLDGGIEDRHVSERVTISIARIRRPSETPIIIEKLMQPKEHNPPFGSDICQSEVSWKEFTTRHGGGGFLLFMDGHVGYMTRKQVEDAPHAPEDYNQPGTVIWNPRGASN